MQPEYRYTAATESELDDLLMGKEAGLAMTWSEWSHLPRLTSGLTGVVWMRGGNPFDPVRPLALICDDDGVRRLCGRYAQLHSDLSPLTAWCHLLTPTHFELLNSPVLNPGMEGLEAAWTGLVVAEALLLSDRSLSSLRLPACLATQSFAVARTNALWSNVPTEEVVGRFDSINRLCRSDSLGNRILALRLALEPIWATLTKLAGRGSLIPEELLPLVTGLRALQRARINKDPEEARHLAGPLLNVAPEADTFEYLTSQTPEMRLRTFDRLAESLNKAASERTSLRHSALALLAGYLATVAAGGAPSLTLAENSARRLPEITAWAYVTGSIGERVIWTSGFDGLARLIARELIRPLRLEDPPTCDFSYDEAIVLADSKLADPLVHLRVKQGRVATVGLLPGVNVSVPIGELRVQDTGRQGAARQARPTEHQIATQRNPDIFSALANAIWPYLRARIQDTIEGMQEEDVLDNSVGSQPTRTRRKSTSQSQLPLKDSRR